MIGNDVVDLSISLFDSEQRFWRYSKKVCSARELKQFGKFELEQLSLWRFWSLKEAGYKAAVRQGYQGVFSPINTRVDLLDCQGARVQVDQFMFKGRSTIKPQEVWSEVVLIDLDFKAVISVDQIKDIKLGYCGRLPYVEYDQGKKLPASITHHGSFFRLIHLSS